MSRSRSRSPAKVTFSPLHPHVGARVEGIDLNQISETEILKILGPALERYGLLHFPNQKLSPPAFFDVLRRFPDVDLEELSCQQNPFAQKDPSCLPELPTVRALGTMTSDPKLHRNARPETNEMGMEWHTDGCGITGLYAAEVPSTGQKRTTCWASGYHAWDLLDEEMKEKARQLRLRFGPKHTMEASVAELFRRGGRMSSNGLKLQQPIDATRLTPEELKKREENTNSRRYLHFQGSPVRRHPFTGKCTLWSMPVFLESCEGMTDQEARDMLEKVLLPGTSGDAVYIHEWSPGDFVVWDNRSTLHSATEVIDAPQLMYQTFLRTKTPMKAVDKD
eukprot:symbB.v1.2.020795.t1/scaffold1769.1/size102324/5